MTNIFEGANNEWTPKILLVVVRDIIDYRKRLTDQVEDTRLKIPFVQGRKCSNKRLLRKIRWWIGDRSLTKVLDCKNKILLKLFLQTMDCVSNSGAE